MNNNINAQTTKSEYLRRIEIIYANINDHLKDERKGLYLENIGKHENPYSYLWPLCALIQATNEMETLNPNTEMMKPVVSAINHYYSKDSPAPAYMSYINKSSRFYDDNQWIAIAYLDAYNRTKKEEYLSKSKEIYTWLLTGYDEKTGGGLYWKEDEKTSKNTCSNGPNILVSLELYKITKEKKYLDTGLLVYNWTNKHLRSKEGVFWDAISIKDGKIGFGTYTYNTGTMLQANVLLYEITGDKKYLKEAKFIATAAEKHFYKNSKLPDHYWFNAVLLRGYEALYQVEKDPQRLKFIVDDADRVWNNERDESNFLGREKTKSLLMQAGILEIYARLAKLNLTKS
ncbi:glycoside hydrolase family 76 protein [Pedobacter mucosus]|uniref:glycoside hydrolase family 76 protein n=1 Tax=Pedobacter mucosus TaxID=2895286 RepID=UPI001EE3F675|nr:glycoside hydrolase family 76 protein [Pedobacter mucosus]UKT65626.1 glycoside hydrolase family 76 protein [Pedobacter mucosus]